MYQRSEEKRETNPREKAGLLSIITFFFTYKIFKKGIQRELEEHDVFEILKDYRSNYLGDKIEVEWEKETQKEHPKLLSPLLRVFGKEYAICGIVQCIVRTAFMVVRPLAIGRLVSYFSPKSTMSKTDAYAYAFAVIALTVFITIYNHGYMLYMQQMAQKIRIGLCSLMYRKALMLNSSSLAEITTGKIVTLMSKDVNFFDSAIIFVHDLWIGFIQVALMTYVMYEQIGVSALYGVGFLVLLTPFQLWIGKQTTKTRLKVSSKTDQRLALIQEILSYMQIIKIYTWEEYFCRLVNFLRKIEIGKLKIIFYLKATMLTIGNLSTRISFFICMMVFIYHENHITAEKAFVVLSCYSSLRSVLTIAIPLGIAQIAELRSAIQRITHYLLIEDVSKNVLPRVLPCIEKKTDITAIEVKGASATVARNKIVLEDINLSVKSGLVVVTGGMGSGKSTLLKLFLEDINLVEGNVSVQGTVSYASQEPWLFPGTIRENILFGLPLNVERYQTVVRVCALVKDLNSFAKSDYTIVGDKGNNLSKGQQIRINMARAVYKEADIYLLDNPFSSLDINVGKQVFNSCIRGFLQDKLCVLVSNQKQYLVGASTVLVMKDHTIANTGTYEELTNSGINLGFEYDKQLLREKEFIVGDYDEDYDEESQDSEMDLILNSTDSIHHRGAKLYTENKKQGRVEYSVYRKYFKFAGEFLSAGILLVICIIVQSSASYFDYFVTHWINVEQKLYMAHKNIIDQNNSTNETTYNYQNYSNNELLELQRAQSRVPIIYSIILAISIVSMLGKSFYFFTVTSRCSIKVHKASFTNVIKAPMTFFDMNLSGNILNRFSKDFCASDEFIPYIILECLKIIFIIIGVLVLITIVNYNFLFLSMGFGVVLFVVRHYYLLTSRSLKRLDGITRSPVIGHLTASLDGLTTIRSHNAQNILTQQFDRHQDLHSSTAYMYLTTNRAFGFYLDMLCAIYITMITLSFVMFFSNTSAGQVGLVITQVFGLIGLLQWGIRQWAELENQMTSVERIMEYAEIKCESKTGIEPDDWPKEGKVTFKNVHLRYPKTHELILRDINFTINPGEKIGVVGRTGAGKTSLISALFRLYNLESGIITVDDIDIGIISLKKLRGNISIIPQNPVLFSGSLRSNLDPDGNYSDEQLWKTLDVIKMKNVCLSLEQNLDYTVSEGGLNFSSGQRQLICLGRAILRHNKIIVMDEATANVDPDTDIIIHELIKKEFASCTVITIAHRLNSVLGCDKVMVIEAGSIVEFDTKDTLLNDKESTFYKMMFQAGLQ